MIKYNLSTITISLLIIICILPVYIDSAVCDTVAKKLKRYCQLTGNQKNAPWLLFFEGNNAYAKYGIFNGILNDPTSGQVKATNPTCTSSDQQLFQKWSQVINLPRASIFQDNKVVTVVNNVMNPDNNTGLGITAVGTFDGCLFGITWDYSKGASQVDIHLTKVELDYPVNQASNEKIQGKTSEVISHSFTGVSQADYQSPCKPTQLYYDNHNNCFFFLQVTNKLYVNKLCYPVTTPDDRVCRIKWGSTAPTKTKVTIDNLQHYPIQVGSFKNSSGDQEYLILRQYKNNNLKHFVTSYVPKNNAKTTKISTVNLPNTSGELTIGVVKDYAIVIADTSNKKNYYYEISNGASLGAAKTDVHRLIQAKQDKQATQLLYGLDYDTNKIYLIERVLTQKMTINGVRSRLQTSNFGIGRYYLVISNIGNGATDRNKQQSDSTVDYGYLYHDVYDIERHTAVDIYTKEYTGCKMQYASVNDPVTNGQDCEDSNDASGDGCSPNCQIESGWECSGYCK